MAKIYSNRTRDKQEVKAITDQLEEGLKELFANEKYKSYLSMMSKFHNYSANNIQLIAMQCPDATFVAGRKAWENEFNRQVNGREEGIRILAPAPYTIEKEQDKVDPVPVVFEDIPGSTRGYFSPSEKRIAVQEGMDESQTIKTMVHETAHAMLHDKQVNRSHGQNVPVKDERTQEVEAESIAYTVCKHFGIDTSEYSFGYIAGWSSRKGMKELKSYNAEEVLKAKKERHQPIIIPHFSCHHLRHTFCTRFCEKETNVKVIQAVMGHANIETTMDIYAEVTDAKKKEAIENLSHSLDIF